jgi:hypothetical protein
MIANTVEGMKAMRETRMVAYPIPFLGFQLDVTSKITRAHPQTVEIREAMLKKGGYPTVQ